jgi:RhoGAP domain
VLHAHSPALVLAVGAERWQILCSDRTARLRLVEDVLNQKYKFRIFGQSIAFLAERDGDSVPEIVRLCAKELRKRAQEEGIFRIPGRSALIDHIVKQVNSGNRIEIQEFGTHDIAGIFKVWYRMLPSSVIPRPLLQDFVRTNNKQDEEERCTALRTLVERRLPTHNARVLGFTLQLLAALQAQHLGKMDADNLATIFAPALFFSLNQPDQTKEEILENARLGPDLKTVVAFLILHLGKIMDDSTTTLKNKLMEAAK